MSAVLLSGVELWAVAGALVVALAVAWLFGSSARWLLRRRAKLGTATSIVISVLGTAAGLFLAGWIAPQSHLWSLLTIALGLGCSIGGIALYAAVAAHFQHPQRASIAELLAAGESDHVEFKSTTRVNLRTGAKDDRMEQIITKTVAAFLNADGGTLLVGVDDAGRPLGLDRDLATLKVPDLDRYELWLRDLLTTGLGQNAAASVGIDFAHLPAGDDSAGPDAADPDDSESADGSEAADNPVCRLTCRPSPRPVYLRGARGAAPELWVRSGNSTRQLGVDEATEYVMHRWPLNLGSSIAAQLRAAVRFSKAR